jgi:hypothetical protein
MALWTDHSALTAPTRTHFRGSRGASSGMAYRTFGPLYFPEQHSANSSARGPECAAYQYCTVPVLLTVCLFRNPDTDGRSTGSHQMSGCSCCLALPEDPRSSSLTRVTTHPMAGPLFGATPAISKASPQSPPDAQLLIRFAADDPRRPTNYKTGTRMRHPARHERLRTFTDAPRGEDRE